MHKRLLLLLKRLHVMQTVHLLYIRAIFFLSHFMIVFFSSRCHRNEALQKWWNTDHSWAYPCACMYSMHEYMWLFISQQTEVSQVDKVKFHFVIIRYISCWHQNVFFSQCIYTKYIDQILELYTTTKFSHLFDIPEHCSNIFQQFIARKRRTLKQSMY